MRRATGLSCNNDTRTYLYIMLTLARGRPAKGKSKADATDFRQGVLNNWRNTRGWMDGKDGSRG